MARTVTLGELATRVRYEADLVNNQFVTDAMLYQFISDSYAVLYNKLLRADPERYMREQTPTLDSAGEFEVPADYYGTIALDWSESANSGIYTTVPRLFGIEANAFDHDNSSSGVPTGWHPRYNNTDPTTTIIRVLPLPDSRYVLRHKYTVAPAEIATSTDVVDGIAGWEEFIVLEAAITCRVREESATGPLERRLARYQDELDTIIEARNVSEAGRVIDTRRRNWIYDPAIYSWYTRD